MESAGEQPTHRPIHLKARNDLPIAMGIHEMQTKSRASQGAQRQRIRLPTPREADSIPGSGRSPGEDNGNPLQYSCLENPMHRGAWQATVHGVPRVGHDLATKPSPSSDPGPLSSRPFNWYIVSPQFKNNNNNNT